MKWRKLGRIFNPKVLQARGLSASLMPIVEKRNSYGLVRVYFSPRDKNNCSEVHWFEVNLNAPQKLIRMSRHPLLLKGKIGTFDDSGITLGSIVNNGSVKLLYYTGWNLTMKVPMNNSIGVAQFDSKGRLFRYGDGPVMTRTLKEPYSCASPFVIFEKGVFRMWYASMDKWDHSKNTLLHYYNIKYAESNDGLNWQRNTVCIDYTKDHYAFGRPFVLIEDGVYKMWYAYRGKHYKIGYAESHNGIEWNRQDEKVGISVSRSGWDSEMIEYPYIYDYKDERYMFYNGNQFGKTGIGLAKLEKKL